MTKLNKSAKTSAPIHPLLQNRWSPRAFTGESIDSETLTKLFEAARWAPSAFNAQPWRFFVAKRENEAEFARLHNLLMDGNKPWTAKAGALVIIAVKTRRDADSDPSAMRFYDAGLAGAQLTIEALANGLHVHQMAGILRDDIAKTLDFPFEYEPAVALAIGHLADPDTLEEPFRERELGERSRLPLDELVFTNSFGQSAEL